MSDKAMTNERKRCQGYRLVPYGISSTGTVPCEHRKNGRLCPDADAKRLIRKAHQEQSK